MRLDNKVPLITGAGSGMGRLACAVFAKEGAAVIGTDVNASSLRETADGVTKAGGRIIGLDVVFAALYLACESLRERGAPPSSSMAGSA